MPWSLPLRSIRTRWLPRCLQLLATPVTYGDSGIMTFMVGRDGVVYQKDLGTDTTETDAYFNDYNPDGGWTPAE